MSVPGPLRQVAAPAREAEPFLDAQGVVKTLGGRRVLDGVDLALRRRELLALLGPNGAGKTTLISIMTGLRRADGGRVRLFGADPREAHARRQIGVTPQSLGFPRGLRVREVIDLVRGHALDPVPLDELAERFALGPLLPRQTVGLSGGEMRVVALAIAFSTRPWVVFLDEPTTGLDIGYRKLVWREIRRFVDGGGSVVLTTHYLEEAEALGDRIVVLDKGRIVGQGTVPEIRARLALTRVRFRGPACLADVGIPGLREENGAYVAETDDADAVVRRLVQKNVPFRDLEVAPLGLEAAVLRMTGGTKPCT